MGRPPPHDGQHWILGITKSELGEKNGTMNQGAKNAAGWWSSFVYNLSVDPFHDVLGIADRGW